MGLERHAHLADSTFDMDGFRKTKREKEQEACAQQMIDFFQEADDGLGLDMKQSTASRSRGGRY
jgi:hypothetical protein